MPSRSLARVTVLDLVLIAAVVASAAVFYVRVLRGRGGPVAAHVYLDGNLIHVLPLEKERVVEVPGENVVIEVQGNRVRISESDCPKRICLQTGWISRPGRPIVCVPKKLLIQVKGGRAELDAQTH
ncbi:MAG: NusG domain II-containing protein [candidate division WOR-3 bacterium]|nr:MAG: NusG domain II-containing protein [candidate division WOR-3 bacterium]